MAKSEDTADVAFWHPRQTSDLRGHAAAEKRLLSIFATGRAAHAWLIVGPRGIGKATLAYRLARFLLANSGRSAGPTLFAGAAPATLDVPATSPVFRQVGTGAHPGLFVAEQTINDKTKRWRGEITVDDVRRLTPFFGTTAEDGGWRVAIVDSVDELGRHAANALLKNLEEPPERGVLFLVSHAPGGIPPTIRSRCAAIGLAPLGDDDVATILTERLADLTTEERASLVRLAQGSPGRAIDLARAGGIDLYRELLALLAPLPGGLDVRAVHLLGDRLNRHGQEGGYRVFTGLVVDWLARMIAGASSGRPAVEVVAGEQQVAAGLWRSRSLAQWLEVWENLRDLVVRADAVNLDRKQVILNIFTTLDQAARV
ncbi:MAG: DNA polymerase III subunit delta' [Alphaproteobacteria bacterium]|nr:DNA polymerase III subunit delta' [Alphaproteobacteria bacterium]